MKNKEKRIRLLSGGLQVRALPGGPSNQRLSPSNLLYSPMCSDRNGHRNGHRESGCMLVYVVGWSPDGPVKVGVARSVQRRIEGLQAGCPFRLVALAEVAGGAHAYAIEYWSHRDLRDFRMQREWFNCPAVEAAKVVQAWADAFHKRALSPPALGPDRSAAAYYAVAATESKARTYIQRRDHLTIPVSEIRMAYARGEATVRDIAAQFGVCARTVYRVCAPTSRRANQASEEASP